MEKTQKETILKACKRFIDEVGSTLGPGGSLVYLNSGLTKDGVSVANEMRDFDRRTQKIIELIRESCNATVQKVGDGTTTATLLTCYIITSILENDIEKSLSYKAIKDNNLQVLKLFKKFIAEYKTTNINIDIIKNVLAMSSNNDPEIIKVLKHIYLQGQNPNISLHKTSLSETKVEINKGYVIENGLAHFNFIGQTGNIHLENCSVLLSSSRLENFINVTNIAAKSKEEGKPLIILGKDFSESFVKDCLLNFNRGTFIIPVRLDDFQSVFYNKLSDLNIFTGADIVEESDLNLKHLQNKTARDINIGFIKTFKANSQNVFLEANEGKETIISERIAFIDELCKQTADLDKINKFKNRINNLRGNYVNVYVGGLTTNEINEKYDRYEDAVGSLKSMQNGVIVGGGKSFQVFYNFLETEKYDIDDNILTVYKGLYHFYYKCLWRNFFVEEEQGYLLHSLNEDFNYTINLNSKDLSVVDGFKEGILDSTEMLETVFETSISTANLVLSISHIYE